MIFSGAEHSHDVREETVLGAWSWILCCRTFSNMMSSLLQTEYYLNLFVLAQSFCILSYTNNCVCNCVWTIVCVCTILFSAFYVDICEIEHMCAQRHRSSFHYVCLLLKLSVQFWIKAKQVSLWLQTDGRPHAETRILSSHLFLSPSLWSLSVCLSLHFYPCLISTGWLFTQGAFMLTILYESSGVSPNLKLVKKKQKTIYI